MEGFNDLKIIGLDKARPPQVLNYPCIFLFFELNHEAPKEWCSEFNSAVAKWKFSTKIDETEGMFIETWVRLPEEIAPALAKLKLLVPEVSASLLAKIRAKAGIKDNGDKSTVVVSDAQRQLNDTVRDLDFS